jgi:hypothetical protein
MYVIKDSEIELQKSMASAFNSKEWDTSGMEGGSIEMAWAGFNGTTSTMKLQGSNTGVNWCDVDDSEFTLATGATGDKLIAVTPMLKLKKMRISYSPGNATTGTVTILASAWVVLDSGQPGGHS